MQGQQLSSAALQPCPRCCRPGRGSLRVRADQSQAPEPARPEQSSSGKQGKQKPGVDVSLAPVKPQTAMGEMLSYYLKMEPHLFKSTVETELQKLKEERDRQKEAGEPNVTDSTEVVLYRRIQQHKVSEARMNLEDLMYVSVLEKFLEVGVEMMPRLETVPSDSSAFQALTEGIHSAEALDMVKEHVSTLLGQAHRAYPDAKLQMSKLQAAQVYAASIMFGYFVRRVDKRFQLENKMRSLPWQQEDPVARLERLFARADQMEAVEDPDTATPSESMSDPDSVPDRERVVEQMSEAVASSSGSSGEQSAEQKRDSSALRRYIESFDRETLAAMARLVSTEGASLVERQVAALFGDLRKLQMQMQEAVGRDASSMQDLMQRVHSAVKDGKVETVNITVATQRRFVLEAVAFGTFLRDVETNVDTEYALLTPAPTMGNSGGPGGDGLAGVGS